MPGALYRPVDPQVSWPDMERRVLGSWVERDIFNRSLTEREGGNEWVFYEGPPTANGKPGIHHVEARSFKDLFCRFQTMRGHYVHRKAGWDCHGLPVEIEVEKQLGITQKREIEERIGIEEFTRRCRESVTRYVDDWERLTDRIGFWMDMDDAYWTMSRDYVESVWWLLKQIWDKGLLEEDFKVVPYCPRCETALSSHEQHYAGSYRTVHDPSVYVRFPLVGHGDEAWLDDGTLQRTSLLVWTTTPWTLLANMAAAAGTDMAYVRVADPGQEGRFLVLARERVEALLGENVEILEEVAGDKLLGLRYQPPFPFIDAAQEAGGHHPTAHSVRPGDFVTADDGSGIVHMAPYGEEDIGVAKRDGLPIVQMIDQSGRVVEGAGEFAGMWFKDADPKIVEDLEGRGVLFRSETYEHSYPHCWRCGTPLIYYARKDWYIRMSQLRDRLQNSNEATNWQPETIKYGRFGDWLANNVDWSLSRDRYWGTPLPVWRCEKGHAVCIGSFAELAELTGRDLSDLDPHRPHVDAITFECRECGEPSTRVKSVIDAWFDSGAMPFAQWHYPFENKDAFEKRFPANFISEGIDQTRGWFYSLLAIATLVKDGNSYRNCVVLGLLLDAEGRKMSKSLGNVLDPWAVLEDQGADAVRWYFLTGGSPWSARRVSVDIIQEALRKYLLTLWNTYSFWVTYASLEGFDPSAEEAPPAGQRPEIDRWILAELNDTITEVTDSLESFDAARGGRRLDRFVDDLSNWYVRRSRRRFWRSKEDADTRAAFHTLWECLVNVAKMTAPFTPFVADEIFTNLMAPFEGADSVHLSEWPSAESYPADDALRRRMALARRIVALGRAARTDAKVRVRQPLQRALVVLPTAEASDLAELDRLVAEELNVKTVEIGKGLEELVSYSVKPNFKQLGPRYGPKVKLIATTLAQSDAAEIIGSLEDTGEVHLDAAGEQITLSAEDLDVRVEGRAGFSLVQDGPYGVALDLDLTPELESEGIAREVVRAIQDLRKSSGLAVEDRISLWMHSTQAQVAEALEAHRSLIAQEVLATETELRETPSDGLAKDVVELDHGTAAIALRRAPA